MEFWIPVGGILFLIVAREYALRMLHKALKSENGNE